MHILVTNDDGVHAPGLAAIAGALARWAAGAPAGEDRRVTVVAPLANHSGASAAVGTFYERESIAYRAVRLASAPDVPAYGIDGAPALAAIIGALGTFGDRPDAIVSGINLGVNVGRSVVHSGTVGAALTGAQLGLCALAVSLRSGADPEPWETASSTAVALLPLLEQAPPRTVLNLNVPSVPLTELRGIRYGRLGTAAIIRSTEDARRPPSPPLVAASPASSGASVSGIEDEGEIRLRLGAAVPSLGSTGGEDPEDDASLIAAGYASLTPLVGIREDNRPEAEELIEMGTHQVERLLAAYR